MLGFCSRLIDLMCHKSYVTGVYADFLWKTAVVIRDHREDGLDYNINWRCSESTVSRYVSTVRRYDRYRHGFWFCYWKLKKNTSGFRKFKQSLVPM